jgi:hypothetical protein
MPEIRLENLIKCYGAVQVLHGIDLSMANSEPLPADAGSII